MAFTKHRLVLALALLCGGVLLCTLAGGAWWWWHRDLVLLTTAPTARVALPAGTVVLPVAEAKTVLPPLARVEQRPEDGGGAILLLPEAGGANNDKGRAEIPFSVPVAGTYFAWVRCRWNNACGNSVALAVDDLPKFTAGQDVVYGNWHWVRAGRWTLMVGAHTATLLGREDGVAVAEILFAPTPDFVPGGAVSGSGKAADLRRTGDDFDRSPGHGLEPWQPLSGQWDIAFSLDPNRIPNQYSLTGRCGQKKEPAVALLSGDPWDGVRVTYSFCPLEAGQAGVLLGAGKDNRAAVTLEVVTAGTEATLQLVTAEGNVTNIELGDRVQLNQWHRVTVERWAWVLRVRVDDVPVLTCTDLAPVRGAIGFQVTAGAAAFDDVLVEEIPWQAEDGAGYTIPWAVAKEVAWFRSGLPKRAGLYGRRGEISTGRDGLPIRALLLDEPAGPACRIVAPELNGVPSRGGVRLFDAPVGREAAGASLVLVPAAASTVLRRVAVAYGQTLPDRYSEGPYHFTDTTMVDPADYLDFTPAEVSQTTDPAQADKLKREMKTFPVVGPATEASAWSIEGGSWAVRGGVLTATGSGAVRYWRDLYGVLDFRCRLRLAAPGAVAGIELYRGAEPGVRVQLGTVVSGQSGASANGPMVAVPADGQWHQVNLSLKGKQVIAAVDGRAAPALDVPRSPGGTALLRVVNGSVEFDDVEFVLPRSAPGGFLYTFDRRETDWWRTGGPWVDHGGIACALASHWISLLAPAGSGILWNKRSFGGDLLVTATLEENTEWFGWHQAESHEHHPYDNVCLYLSSDAKPETGYRVEFNSRQRTATVLYRNGVEVAAVRQDSQFPVQYVGGHVPYSPRRSRLAVFKQGGAISVTVNNKEVLKFADSAPLPVSRVGLGGYQTRVNFSRAEIREW